MGLISFYEAVLSIDFIIYPLIFLVMNEDPIQLIRDYPELIRMGAVYFFGFLLIGSIGWQRVLTRSREGSLRQVEPVLFPLPFLIGLGFFFILLSVLFFIRGFTAMGCAVIGYFFLMNQVGFNVSRVLGLDVFPLSKIICAALGLTAIVFAPAYSLSWVNGMICILFKIETSAQPLVFEFLKMTEMTSVLSFIGLAVIAAPVTEEILFRGLLYPVLRDRLGIKLAVGLSAALFALAHVHAPTFLPLMFLGVMLALAYEYSGSLLLSILIHAIFNLFTVLNLLLLKPYLLK